LTHRFKQTKIFARPDTSLSVRGISELIGGIPSSSEWGFSMQTYKWWPWALVLAGALILWILGFDYRDQGAIWMMGILIMAAGGYLVLWEKRGWRK
jgi:hypothetical protein